MNKQKKIGILLIITGICVPLMALPFVSGWSGEKSFIDNFLDAGIQIREEKTETSNSKAGNITDIKNKKITYSDLIPSKIPFRLFLAVTVLLGYIGIIKIDSSRQKDKKEQL
jgi:hypothetical protein